MMLSDLVGIPWKVGGRSLNGIDCVGLAILAQRVLCERELSFPQKYGESDQHEKSVIIKEEVERLFSPAKAPETGAVGLFYFGDCWHVATFTGATHFLHIFPGQTSRIHKLTRAYKNICKGVYV